MPGKGGANAAGRGIQRGELMTHLDDLRQEILSRERDLQRRYEQLKSDVQVLKKAALDGERPIFTDNGAPLSFPDQEKDKIPGEMLESVRVGGSQLDESECMAVYLRGG